jgi:hypothetical protein
MAFTTMALLALGAYAASKTVQAKKQQTALNAQQQQLDAQAQPAAPGPTAPTAPPAPPPSATTTASNDVGAAKMAADKQRKLAGAGNTLATPAGPGRVQKPGGNAEPKTLLGY